MNTSDRLAALGNLNDSEDINWACENIKQNFRTSAKQILGPYELKQHKTWFND
jgi:hypothetical protein